MNTPLQLLRNYFGYDSFRPQQEKIITSILNKRDTLVLMPTGGGKSICFQIPALALEGTAIVISPLISLMKDQVESLKSNEIEAVFINSSLDHHEEAEILKRCLAHKIKLLYLSPEKALTLTDHLFRNLQVSLIAIDEAHCISQWGHDFRPEYTQLRVLRKILPGVPIVALTATADKITRKDIVNQLELIDPEIFISSFDRPNFHLSVRRQIKTRDKDLEILNLIREHTDQCGIIYCLSRKATETVCNFLQTHGIPSAYYHAGMDSVERNRVQEDFIFDRTQVICATIAFGMGIDKSNVRWIIHYNLPKNMEGYYQEIGRAGRDGAPAKAILYYDVSDLMKLTRFAQESGQMELNVEKLKRMQQFAESRVCRRKILLSYFGENYDHNCLSCDVCDHPPKYLDGSVIAQKAISALLRTHENVGIRMLIEILRGSMNAELISAGYQHLKTHGAGREYSTKQWESYISQMIQLGVFEMAYDEGFVLKVSEFGRRVVKGISKLEFSADQYERKMLKDDKPFPNPSPTGSLFNELRLLRRQIAESESLPPYLIFHDSTLMQMVELRPVNMQEMLRIPGVSPGKYERFGQPFEKFFQQLKGDSQQTTEIVVQEFFTDEKIASYIGELRPHSVRVSPVLISKLLMGSISYGSTKDLTNVSFFRILKGYFTYKYILSVVSAYFKKFEIQIGTSGEVFAINHFRGDPWNKLNEDQINGYRNAVSIFEINRTDEMIDNEYILEQRKIFPRAYDYWSEEENQLLKELCSQTNDLQILTGILKRNSGNIKTQFKKLCK